MNDVLEKIIKLFKEESPDSSKTFNLIDVTAERSDATQRLFNELQTYSEPPEWIPFLPKPGEYQHSEYGGIVITPERNQHFVDNYQNGAYQKYLPIDLEHDLPNSGAVGHIEDFRLNEDGSVSAQTNWNDRGRAVITGDRFRYFSPAYKDSWTDPVDGKVYTDVAVGGALTTRPFFKDKSLGPIIQKEDGQLFFSEVTSFKEGDQIVFKLFETNPGYSKTVKEIMTTESKEFAFPPKKVVPGEDPKEEAAESAAEEAAEDAKGKNKKMTEETTKTVVTPTITMSEEMTKQFTEMAEKIKTLSESNSRLVLKDRTARFTDVVLGHGGSSDGTRFFGEPAKHVAFLMDLSETHGEESEQVKNYVELQSSIAQQINKANLFGEFGRSAVPTASSTVAEVDGLATKVMSEHTGMTKEQAVTRVLSENPVLYDKYEAERSASKWSKKNTVLGD